MNRRKKVPKVTCFCFECKIAKQLENKMDKTGLEEPEIKIEYEDTNTKDPLSIQKKFKTHATCKVKDIEAFSEKMMKKSATWFKCIDDSGKYCCRFCELSYSTLQTLRVHTKTKHTAEAISLKAAISSNKRNKRLKCHSCKTHFLSLNELELHFKVTHKLNKESYCHICQSVFENENVLSDHLSSKHNIALSKMHTCNLCGYITTKLSHYKQHSNTHFSEASKKCQYCDYETSYLSNLNIHMQIHNEEKPYSCDLNGCLYRSKSCASLKSHQLKHNKPAHFKYCDKCTFKTVYAQTLRKHLDSHGRNTIKLNTTTV